MVGIDSLGRSLGLLSVADGTEGGAVIGIPGSSFKNGITQVSHRHGTVGVLLYEVVGTFFGTLAGFRSEHIPGRGRAPEFRVGKNLPLVLPGCKILHVLLLPCRFQTGTGVPRHESAVVNPVMEVGLAVDLVPLAKQHAVALALEDVIEMHVGRKAQALVARGREIALTAVNGLQLALLVQVGADDGFHGDADIVGKHFLPEQEFVQGHPADTFRLGRDFGVLVFDIGVNQGISGLDFRNAELLSHFQLSYLLPSPGSRVDRIVTPVAEHIPETAAPVLGLALAVRGFQHRISFLLLYNLPVQNGRPTHGNGLSEFGLGVRHACGNNACNDYDDSLHNGLKRANPHGKTTGQLLASEKTIGAHLGVRGMEYIDLQFV